MGLRVIGAGVGRTGTASLKIALEKLGLGRCYHMSEVLADPDHIQYWIDVAAGNATWDRIFNGFGATVDFPACIYWRELASFYPGAKILLSTRDPEAWYRSTQETILGPRWWNYVKKGPFGKMCEVTIERFFDGDVNGREHLIQTFNEHAEAVKREVPADRLLVFEARQGWAPLCEFLGVDVPDEPFPHANSEEETTALFEEIIASTQGHAVGSEALDQANALFSSDRK